jgi:hypothetical protein
MRYEQVFVFAIADHQLLDSMTAENVEEERGSEAEWQEKLRSLEQWICELLIKNQRLRMSLESTVTSERGDHDASNV